MTTRGKNLNSTDIAYLAGLFDGEGNINIYQLKAGKSGRVTNSYELSVAIYNTHRPVIDWLYENFGGYVQTKSYGKTNSFKSHWKDNYTWKIGANKALEFLEMVRPFLRIKDQQADVAIKFQFAKSHRKRVRDGFATKITPELYKLYDDSYMELRRLIGTTNKAHPQRLSEKTPKGEAIV